MEFNEKLQELRKSKGITQEELAETLHVSRTAVSKWESGRGYPNIESLKQISAFYSITIDDLLSGDELLTIAEADQKQKTSVFRDLVFGFLDLSASLLLCVPFFGQKGADTVSSVTLFSLTEISLYMKALYIAAVIAIIACGILTLALQSCGSAFWAGYKNKLSLALNTIGILLFVISLQPYAALFLFFSFAIKTLILTKK